MTTARVEPPSLHPTATRAVTALILLTALGGCSAPGTDGAVAASVATTPPAQQAVPADVGSSAATRPPGTPPSGTLAGMQTPAVNASAAAGDAERALGLADGLASDALRQLLNDGLRFDQAMAALDRAYATDADAQDVRSSYQHALQQRLGTGPDAPRLSRLNCGISHCLGEVTGTLENPSVLFGAPHDAAGRQLPVNEAMVRSILSADGGPTGYRLAFSLDPSPRTGPLPAR
ncbi:hypothetical protein [Stenotrophomonas sp. TWI587]|uniref:hypothetical protein n=1 Tax=Stenotrophomonas sp. TWI587 TaxID=3136783 RepID=UPI003208A0B2